MITPQQLTRGARHRCSKNQQVEDELLKMKAKGDSYFFAIDLAKRTDHMTNGIGNILRFTSGVRCEGKGLWVFTGDAVKVMA